MPHAKTSARLIPFLYMLAALCLTSACTTFDKAERRAQDPSYDKRAVRWDVNEVPYDEVGTAEKAGRNVRDGLIGFVDSYFQGAYSTLVVAGRRGFITQKVIILGGDIVGVIDDNPVTEHVFKGIVSRQLYRFGVSAYGMPKALQEIHEDRWELPEKEIADYIGDRAFHWEAYKSPSGLVTLGAVIVGDFVVRPAGHLVMLGGGRKTGEKWDQAGKDLIEASLYVPFL